MTYRLRTYLQYLVYPLFMTAIFLSGFLPPRFCFWLSRRGGDLAYMILPRRRRVTAENLARVMKKPPAHPDVRRSVRVNMQNYGCYLYETARVSHQSVGEIVDRVRLHSEENILRALTHGNGVILVSAHFGNMDLGAMALANKTTPITVPGTPLKPPQLMNQLTNQRLAKGLKMTVHAGAPRDVINALRQNETVGFCVDLGVTWKDGVTVPVSFFGHTAPFPPGLAHLALRTGALIVPAYAVVRPDHSVDVHALEQISVTSTGNRLADARECMQKVALALETFIRANPEQWYMYRPMWHTPFQPDAASGPQFAERRSLPC
jgi:KDO2-lipid IV(A) lauroyltransferase